MNELRQQMIDAVLVPGFSPRTHKSCLAAMLKTIVIEGLSATELVRFWLTPAYRTKKNLARGGCRVDRPETTKNCRSDHVR